MKVSPWFVWLACMHAPARAHATSNVANWRRNVIHAMHAHNACDLLTSQRDPRDARKRRSVLKPLSSAHKARDLLDNVTCDPCLWQDMRCLAHASSMRTTLGWWHAWPILSLQDTWGHICKTRECYMTSRVCAPLGHPFVFAARPFQKNTKSRHEIGNFGWVGWRRLERRRERSDEGSSTITFC